MLPVNSRMRIRYAFLMIYVHFTLAGWVRGEGNMTGSDPAGLQLTEQSEDHLLFKYHVDIPQFSIENSPEGYFTRILLPGFVKEHESGIPYLPVLCRLIELPAGAEPELRIVSVDETEISLTEAGFPYPLIPVQPGTLKGDTTQPRFVYNREYYQRNEFNRPQVADITEAGVVRGSRMALLTLRPFRYNPLKNRLVMIRSMIIRMDMIHPDPRETERKKSLYYSPLFEQTYKKALNYSPPAKSMIQQRPVRYAILSDPRFRDVLQPFIRWKTRKGFDVVELYKGDPGVGSTVNEYKACLQSLYDNASAGEPAPSFLLIVGDVDQIPPSSSGGHVSDLYYACYDGAGDFVPDLFYGRLSANTVDELMPQLEKTLMYEQYEFPDPSFLNVMVLIAGVDPVYAAIQGNGQINYGTTCYFNEAHGFTAHAYLYPESGSKAEEIKQHISNGVGFVNYTGHGYPDRWENPRLSIADIPGFMNTGKYPLMIGNGCETNRFEITTCLGEALLRAEGKGAVGYIGGTNDSYWDEDYYWAVGVGPVVANPTYLSTSLGAYDRTFHENGEPPDEWYDTQGQMIFAGNMAVTEGSLSRAKYYWEIYHLMGDPSLMIYYGVPGEMSVQFPDTIPPGTEYINVTSIPYAYAALSDSGTLLDAGFTGHDGTITLHLPPSLEADTLELVLTGKNHRPFIAGIIMGHVTGPYITCSPLTISDTGGNNNGLADNGEEIALDFTLTNLGRNDASPVTATLHCTDPYISISDDTEEAGTVPSMGSVTLSPAFLLSVNDTTPDQHIIRMTVELSDTSDNTWYVYPEITVNSPVLTIESIRINDSLDGNYNCRMDAGEQVQFVVKTSNTGHSDASSVTLTLLSSSPAITWISSSETIPSMDPMIIAETVFSARIDTAAGPGLLIDIIAGLSAGLLHSHHTWHRMVGVPYEDFESGDFSDLPWKNDQAHPWIITGSQHHEGSYALESPVINHAESAQTGMDVYVEKDDTLSFYRKVSSEKNWDFLKFYIDGVEKAKWSGESGWVNERFAVDRGLHSLMWKYLKDNNTSQGFDHGWIDDLFLPSTVYRMTASDSISDKAGNNNGILNPGEEVTLFITLRNPGITGSSKVTAMITGADTSFHITGGTFVFTDPVGLTDTTLTCSFGLTVSGLAGDGLKTGAIITLTDSTRGSWRYYTILSVEAPRYILGRCGMEDSVTGNGNGRPDRGEILHIRAELINTGHQQGTLVPCSISIDPAFRHYVGLIDSTFTVNNISPGDTSEMVFAISIDSIPKDCMLIPMVIQTGISSGKDEKIFTLPLGCIYEDFETGDSRRFHWLNDPQFPWTITEADVYEGRYSLRSAPVGHRQSSSLAIRIEVCKEGPLSFNVMVSSEKNYDFVRFYVDEKESGSWSGETGWIHVTRPLTAGCHTLRWTYSKDGNMTGGSDMAVIDLVIFPDFVMCPLSVGVTAINSPVSGPFLTVSEPVNITVTNCSSDTIENIPVGYLINDGQPVREFIPGKVAPGTTIGYTFAATTDLSVNGDYLIRAFTSLPGDQVFTDDTATVLVSRPELNDLSVTHLEKPQDDSSLGMYETVKVLLHNLGNTCISNFTMGYIINDGLPVEETVWGNILPGQSIGYVFTTPADMLEAITYELKVYVSIPGDISRSNDTLTATFANTNPDAVDRPEEMSSLRLYPNPCRDFIHLDFWSEGEHECYVSVYSAGGVKKAEKTLQTVHGNNHHTLYLGHFDPGIYFLEIRSAERQMVFCVIRQ